LAGIIGIIDILSTTTLNNDQMSLLTTAKKCSQTLMEIINDVLDLSKVHRKKNDFFFHFTFLTGSDFDIIFDLFAFLD
jgi:signal transduction histidine kinase